MSTRRQTCIVIGAGAAGVSAAFRLRQAGMAVRLVEREARVGGRTSTEQIGNFILDTGAGILPGTYKAVQRLMHDAGLSHLLDKLNAPTAIPRDGERYYLDPNKPLVSLITTGLLSGRAKLSLTRLPLRALRMWKDLGFDNLGTAAPYDVETVASYARRELSQEALDFLVGPIVRTMYSVSPGEASIVDLFWCFRNLLSNSAFCIRGGMSQLAARVAENVDLRVGTEALSVSQVGDRVEVTLRNCNGRSDMEVYDLCVIATRSRDVPKLFPTLDADARAFLEALAYTATTDLHLRLRSRPEERAVVLMVPDSVEPDICTVLLQHNKGRDRAPPGKGAVSFYFHHRWAAEVAHMSDQEVFDKGMGKVERVMPGIGREVEGFKVQRWDHTATKSFPGYYRKLADFTRRLDPRSRIQLAGDYFALACVNTAVVSGENAAARLVANFG